MKFNLRYILFNHTSFSKSFSAYSISYKEDLKSNLSIRNKEAIPKDPDVSKYIFKKYF
jgi:hypothetical protein